MAVPLLIMAARIASMGVPAAVRSGIGRGAIKKAQAEFKKRFGKNLTKGTKVPKSTPRDDTAKMIADDVMGRSSKGLAKGERRVTAQGKPPATVGGRRVAKNKPLEGELLKRKGSKLGKVGTALNVASLGSALGSGDKKQKVGTNTVRRNAASDATAAARRSKNAADAGAKLKKMATPKTKKPPTGTGTVLRTPARPPLRSPSSDATAKAKAGRDAAKTKVKAAKQPDYMKYKTIAEAKKAGSSTYSKNGKEMAAVFKEDLKPGESLRDYMNARTGKPGPDGKPTTKRRIASNTPLTELSRNKDGTPADPKEFNKRIKDGTTLVNKRKGGGVKKMKKMNMGGMTKAAYQAGGKLNMVKGKDGKMVPDYAADGVGKMKKGGGVKKKTKKMNMGGMTGMPADGMDAATMMAMKKKRKKPMMPAQQAMGGGAAAPMMKKGGKVRGAGIARKGVRAAKMR